MWPIISIKETVLILVALLALVALSVRLLEPKWWQARAIRLVTFSSFGAMFAGTALWTLGELHHRLDWIHAGAGAAYTGILILAPAILLLPLSALLSRTLSPAPAPALALAPARASLSRRSLLHALPAALPTLGALTGASGLVAARLAPRLRVIPMRYENLHADLDGLRILQLSDLHLGVYATLADLEHALEDAVAAQHPDLIVLTGDLADDPSLIPGALDLVARVAARHGALASLGNHEYLHGIEVTRPLYEESRVPLLVSTGRTLTIGRARLFVGGSDDPVHIHGDIAAMLRPSIERAAAHAESGAQAPHFRLLLCHRPEGFGPATDNGFDLTLSGHTHGGQIGLFGRSIFEKLMPGTGWWGTYARKRAGSAGPSRLYTTSGFGHWFPFRVGCPTEMPVIVLERGSRRTTDRAEV